MIVISDYIGWHQPNGKLTILYEDEVPLGKERRVIVQCDCGSPTRSVRLSEVINERSRSCGTCIRKSLALGNTGLNKRISRLGFTQKNGRLTIIEELEGTLVVCKCYCGNVITCNRDLVVNNKKLHCGCVPKAKGIYNGINVMKFLGKNTEGITMVVGVCTNCGKSGIWTPNMITNHICGVVDLFDNEVEETKSVKMKPM